MINVIIYKFTNKINNKIYIGITKTSFKKRLGQHLSESKTPRVYFHKALNKYGIDNFIVEILEEVNDYELAKQKEIEYIKNFNCLAPNGYNSTKGGDGQLGTKNFLGKKHTKEECIRIGKRHLGNKYCVGIKRTELQIQAIIKAHTGKKLTDLTKYKMRLGKANPVICLNDNKEFINGSHAAEYYNLSKSDVYKVLRKAYKHTKGYKFEYIGKETKKVN